MQNNETVKTESARRLKLSNNLSVPLFIMGIIVFLFVILGLWLNVTLKETGKTITVGNQSFGVEVADTVSEREKGLSERDNLPANKGMLFDFGSNGDWQIWMPKMRFPIDIAWLSKEGKIVAVSENVSPDTFPNVFRSDVPAWYVLELNAGAVKETGVKVGDTIRLE